MWRTTVLGNSDLTTTILGWCNPGLYDHLNRMSVRLGSDTACVFVSCIRCSLLDVFLILSRYNNKKTKTTPLD